MVLTGRLPKDMEACETEKNGKLQKWNMMKVGVGYQISEGNDRCHDYFQEVSGIYTKVLIRILPKRELIRMKYDIVWH